MAQVFQGRSFLKEMDFTKDELNYLIDFAIHLKALKQQHIPHKYMEGQTIAMLFQKTSTRTRSAFTVAAHDLGAHAEFLGPNDTQFGKKESVEDTARVLGSMYDGIEFRGASQQMVEDFAKYSGVPVWNGLTDEWHPTQMIADFMTMKEEFGSFEGKKLVYCGDGRNNMANSLLVTGAILGVNVTIATAESLFPSDEVMAIAKERAAESGAHVEATTDIKAAVKDADALYTDVWASMGEEDKFKERIDLLQPYQINRALLNEVEGDYIILHCLPAFHDTNTTMGQEVHDKYGLDEMEITDEAFRDDHGRMFEEAANRMPAIKAIMAATAGHLFIPRV